METARTVAAVITESVTTGNGDDVSAITAPTSQGAMNNQVNNQTQERAGVPTSLGNLSQMLLKGVILGHTRLLVENEYLISGLVL